VSRLRPTELRALRARTSGHADRPHNTSWRGVREDRMAAACAELLEDTIKARACERPG
jgi:hypothetical protein